LYLFNLRLGFREVKTGVNLDTALFLPRVRE